MTRIDASEQIDRRRLFGAAALGVAVAELGLTAAASAQTGSASERGRFRGDGLSRDGDFLKIVLSRSRTSNSIANFGYGEIGQVPMCGNRLSCCTAITFSNRELTTLIGWCLEFIRYPTRTNPN